MWVAVCATAVWYGRVKGGGTKEKVDPHEGNPRYQKRQKITLKRSPNDLPVLQMKPQRQIRERERLTVTHKTAQVVVYRSLILALGTSETGTKQSQARVR